MDKRCLKAVLLLGSSGKCSLTVKGLKSTSSGFKCITLYLSFKPLSKTSNRNEVMVDDL